MACDCRNCDACGYDLRGLYDYRCPECGSTNPKKTSLRAARPVLGVIGALLSLMSTLHLKWWTIELSLQYARIHWYGVNFTGVRCGTGRMRMLDALWFGGFAELLLIAIGLVIAIHAKFAIPLARGSMLSATAWWITCIVLIANCGL